MLRTHMLGALAATALLAACGGDDKPAAEPAALSVTPGEVLLADSFDDERNRNGWLLVDGLVEIEDGEYVWRETPAGGGNSLPDSEFELDIPAGVQTSIDVTMTRGAALRGLTCRERELEGKPEREAWYELGVDGRRAQIRRMSFDEPPEVLEAADAPIPTGRRVRLTAQCVPDPEGGLHLALSIDGREVVTSHDADPVTGAPGTVAVFGYARPDSEGPADMAWDDFELRAATAERS